MADGWTLVVEHVPETSSRCVTESVTGTFNFEVTNYPQIKGMAAGKFIRSRGFRVGGYDWRIDFYPSGLDTDTAGNASAYVELIGGGKEASAKFTLSVLEGDGHTPVASHDAGENVYRLNEIKWGFSDFVARSKLKRNGDGSFTIRCVLTVRNESPPLELPAHLERMLRDGTGADITFVVGCREFRAHSFLLAARSPEFRAQLSGRQVATGKDEPCVQVADMDAAIFEMMLHYIYTDSMPRCGDDEGDHDDAAFQHLLVAAERYGLQRLKMMCEEELCKRMDVETVMARFLLANQHGCKRLKEACLQFMSSPQVLAVVLENIDAKDHLTL